MRTHRLRRCLRALGPQWLAMSIVRALPFALLAIFAGCGAPNEPADQERPREAAPRTTPEAVPSATPTVETPTPTPSPTPTPHPFTLGVIEAGWTPLGEEYATARVGLSDHLQGVSYTSWTDDEPCSVYGFNSDGYSLWWDGFDVGTSVTMNGPVRVEIPLQSAEYPGWYAAPLESGTLIPGDYVVSWPGGEDVEGDDGEYFLSGMTLDPPLTIPPRLELTEPTFESPVEIAPGLVLRWEPSTVSTRLLLTIRFISVCSDDIVEMVCRLADDGHFELPDETRRLPRANGTMRIVRETIRTHPTGEHNRVILLRGISTVFEPINNAEGADCGEI